MFNKRYFARYLLAMSFIVAPLIAPLSSSAASNAQLSLSGSGSSVTTGQNLVININLDTGGNSVLAWKTTLSYSTSAFSSVSVATATGSPFTFTPVADVAGSGTIKISRYAKTPSATSGAVATITLKAANLGNTAISFAHICSPTSDSTPCSAVTGSGGDQLLSAANTGTYTVSAVPVAGGGSAAAAKTTTKKKGFIGAVAAAVGTVAATVTGDQSQSNTTNNQADSAVVKVRVVDTKNKAIENAEVTLNRQTVFTGSNGEALFTQVPNGKLTGQIKYKGKTQTFEVNVTAGSSFDDPQLTIVTLNVAGSSALGKYLGLALLLVLMAVVIFWFLHRRDGGQKVVLTSDPDIKPTKPEPLKTAAAKVEATKSTTEKTTSQKPSSKDKTIKRNDPLKPGVVVRPSDDI